MKVDSVRSSKSFLLALIFCGLIETSKDNENLFVCVAYSSSLAKTICGNYIQNYFTTNVCNINTKYRGFEAASIKIPGKPEKYIIFVGGGNNGSESSIRGLTLTHALVEEGDKIAPSMIEELLNRQATFLNGRILISLNPNVETHVFYQYLNTWQKNNAVYYNHFTMLDNPIMTKELIDNMKKKYAPGSLSYLRYIEGKRVNAEDALFEVNDYNIVDEINPESILNYIIVADPGESISATVFIAMGLIYDQNKGKNILRIFKQYYHLNDKHTGMNIKMFKDYAEDLAKFEKECVNIIGKHPTNIVLDDSVEFYRNVRLAYVDNQLNYSKILYPTKPTDEERINQICSLLYSGQIEIFKDCNYCIKDLKEAVLDRDAANKGKIKIKNDYTTSGHQDSLDSIVYGIQYYYNRLFYKSLL